MVNEEKRRKITRNVQIYSQNARGIKTDTRLEELFAAMLKRNVLAVCLQETWRNGTELLDHGNCKLISTGIEKANQLGNRGSEGVAIALSPDGVTSWKAAGCESHTDLGSRVMAIRLILKDHQRRDVGLFLISAYAPVGNAAEEVWDSYFLQIDRCMARKNKKDILVIGTDCNSSMGCQNGIDGPLGRFGIPHVNDSGRRFLSYLLINNLAVMTTSFMKKRYATWIHPRSKKDHQIDHFIVNKDMAHRVLDAGVTFNLIDSDHQAIFIKLRVMKRLRKKTEPRQRMINLDHSKLSHSITCSKFCQSVIAKL